MREYRYPIVLLLILGLLPVMALAKGRNKFFQDDDAWFLRYLTQDRFPIDSNANAVILFEQSSYDLETEVALSGTVNRDVHRIIKILKPGGIQHGDQTIIVPTSNRSSTAITQIRACTYSLRDGKLVAQKLDPDLIVRNRTDHFTQAKFSMPAVEPGTILDISYKVKTALSLLFAEHHFQHEIPTLYSELELFIPHKFGYLTVNQGAMRAFTEFDDRPKSVKEESLPDAYTLSVGEADFTQRRWVRRNVPAISGEPFAPNVANYRERLLLRINGIYAPARHIAIADTWEKIDKVLLESFSFYQATTRRHQSLIDKVRELTANVTDPEKKARLIYCYLRGTMSAEGYSGIFTGTDMDRLLAKQNATPSEINLILFSMMRMAGLDARPMLITTSDDPSALKELADLSQFTKTICQVSLAGTVYNLDASGKQNAFGQLGEGNYNGYARVIGLPKGRDYQLDPSGLRERHLVSIATANASVDSYAVKVTCHFGQQAAARHRAEWRKNADGIRSTALNSLRNLGSAGTLLSCSVQGLDNPDTGLILQYIVRLDWAGRESVFLNPHLLSYFPENPFRAGRRSLPVELPSAFDIYYNVALQVPQGYRLDDAPLPMKVTLGSQDNFAYAHSYDPASGALRISSRIHLERTWFPVTEYEGLKQFFDKVIESQQHTYVFTKS